MKVFTQTHNPVIFPVMGSTFLEMMRSVSGVVSTTSMIIGMRTRIRGNTVGEGELWSVFRRERVGREKNRVQTMNKIYVL